MNFEALVSRLKISAAIPEALPKLFLKTLPDTYFLEHDYINEISEKYDIFEEKYLELILKATDEIKENEDLLTWAKLSVLYLKENKGRRERVSMPMPEPDGTAASDMLMTIVTLPLVEEAAEVYRSRGFSEDDIKKNFKALNTVIWIGEKELGRPVSRKVYFGWNMHYMCCTIFDHGVFNFEISSFPQTSMLLKNKATNEFAIMMLTPKMHRDGYILGSLCHTDEDGAFGPDFIETDTDFTGYLAKDGKVINKLVTLSKSEWEAVLRPGDPTVSIHIPRKTNLTPEVVKESLVSGFKKARLHYPEHQAKFLTCHSWLLSIELYNHLGESSNILKFGEIYERYPLLSQGRDCMKFLFPKDCDSLEELEDATSLQAKVKKSFLEGGYIYSAGGIITNEEFYK